MTNSFRTTVCGRYRTEYFLKGEIFQHHSNASLERFHGVIAAQVDLEPRKFVRGRVFILQMYVVRLLRRRNI